MGLLGNLKNRILRRRDDEFAPADIRSHVLGERFAPEPAGTVDVPEFPDVRSTKWQRGYSEGPADFGPEPLAPRLEPALPEKEGSYEIIDRLNVIEAQLQAIRSQTETINERLKNMEFRMGRRY